MECKRVILRAKANGVDYDRDEEFRSPIDKWAVELVGTARPGLLLALPDFDDHELDGN